MPDPFHVHKAFLGPHSITPIHVALYSSSDRGFSTKEPTDDMLEALVVKALSMSKEDKVAMYYSVFIYVHASLQERVVEAIKKVGLKLKERSSWILSETQRKKTLSIGKQWLGTIRMGVPNMKDLQDLPERWLIVGFSKEDLIPEAVQNSLLSV
jgi:hypothetical protein